MGCVAAGEFEQSAEGVGFCGYLAGWSCCGVELFRNRLRFLFHFASLLKSNIEGGATWKLLKTS